MTTIFLVRHAEHDLVSKELVGRRDGVGLSDTGRRQSDRLAAWFADQGLTIVQSSPRQRALETAQRIGEPLGLPVEIVDAGDEIDCGTWSGRSFDSLAADAEWRLWNTQRDAARIPQGETAACVARRIVRHLESLQAYLPDARILLVSHLDVIRGALLHALKAPAQSYARLVIPPAGVCRLHAGPGGLQILSLNEASAQ
jgi:broad specificity phosphatase PhoE